jgi:hypothetical protein
MGLTMTQATHEQIIKHFEDLGNEVRISKDGRVQFRPVEVQPMPWRDGRWIDEYRIFEGRVVHT